MVSPILSHLVVNTSNYEAMKRWYLNVLEAEIGVETSDHSACFLRTDENNHRVGMFNVAKLMTPSRSRRQVLTVPPCRLPEFPILGLARLTAEEKLCS